MRWCHNCFLRTENDTCPDCGEATYLIPEIKWGRGSIGKLSEFWPLSDDGGHVAPAFLIRCATMNFEDAVLTSMLDAYGIPYLRSLPGNGEFGMLVLGVSGGGVDIYVPETMLDDAILLVKGVDGDESEL